MIWIRANGYDFLLMLAVYAAGFVSGWLTCR